MSLVQTNILLKDFKEVEKLLDNYCLLANEEMIFQFQSAMFCHGVGGMLTCCNQLWKLSHDRRLKTIVDKCKNRMNDLIIKDENDNRLFINKDGNSFGEIIESSTYDSIINGQMSCLLSFLEAEHQTSIFKKIVCIE